MQTSAMQKLGYAGLTPFVVPAILVAMGHEHSGHAIGIANAYAFGIICFLTGTWWGVGIKSESNRLLILSNVVFVAAFLVFGFASQSLALVLAVILACIFVIEKSDTSFSQLDPAYRRMRMVLTTIATLSMLVVFFAG